MANDNIQDRVVAFAERVEDMDSPDELDYLDVEFTVNSNGTVTKVTLIVTTGGPHIELDVTNDVVRGTWGGNRHAVHVDNESVLSALHDRHERRFRENYLA